MSGGSADLYYIFTDALRSLKENIGTTILTAFTLGFSLAIFSLFLFVFMNLNALIEGWGDRTQIVAYVKDTATDINALTDGIKKIPGVAGVEFVSKEKALNELRSELKGHESILEGVDANPLPASFEIKVLDSFNDPARVTAVVERLKAQPWVEDVQFSREWVEKFSALLRFIELAALTIGVFLAAATLFIISNTIRLAVYARKDEIEIMKLVGASDTYIKMPFMLEGVFQGLLGGVLAFALLLSGRSIIVAKMPAYLQFTLEMPLSVPLFMAALALTGVLMGVAGSLISMGRFLRS